MREESYYVMVAERASAAYSARSRMEAARDAGAELVLAPCPFCVVNLGRAGMLEVRDLADFLASRLERQ